MYLKKRLKIIGILLWGLCCYSCVEDLDFEQAEEFAITPVYEFDFIFSNFDTTDILPEEIAPDVDFFLDRPLQDTINYELTSSDFAINNLERIEFTFEVSNQIERDFELQFQFLNENDQPVGQLYSVPIRAGNGEDQDPVISFSIPNPIVLNKAALEELQEADKVASELIVPELNSNLRGTLDLRSKATYFVNTDN